MKRQLMMQFVRETEGQDLIEYALLAACISIVVIAAMRFVAETLTASSPRSRRRSPPRRSRRGGAAPRGTGRRVTARSLGIRSGIIQVDASRVL